MEVDTREIFQRLWAHSISVKSENANEHSTWSSYAFLRVSWSEILQYLSRGKNYWGTLMPRINVENARIQQIRFCFSIFMHVTLFVWVHYYNYLPLTASFFLYSLIYAAWLLPADILSVGDVIRWQLGYSIALCPSLCALIWLLYQSALSSCVLPE
jgi:hypothetical protein